jgi:hypothetical protein
LVGVGGRGVLVDAGARVGVAVGLRVQAG